MNSKIIALAAILAAAAASAAEQAPDAERATDAPANASLLAGLPTSTNSPLPTTHSPLPTTNYQLPTTNSPLPSTNYQLPTTNSQLSASSFADEIDLEEIDDSAVAAKRPQIRRAEKDGSPVALVDIDCDEATLSDILRQFCKTTGANIISSDSTNLMRRVTVSLRRVPWLQAITSILNSRGFRLDEQDGIYRVVEDKRLVPILTKSFPLNHASAKEIADLFNAAYGKKDAKGSVIMPIASYFDGANVVVVTAEEKTISDCAAIVKAVDLAVSQIYIEARFLEVSNEALHKLGVQWNQLASWGAKVSDLKGGMEYNGGNASSYSTRTRTGSSSSTASVSGSAAADGTRSTSASSSYTSSRGTTLGSLVPTEILAASGAGRTAENMSWLNARGFSGQLSADDFSLALSAFENMADAKIFSNPKVIVSNGKEAKVDMTTKYPNVELTSQRGESSGYAYTDFSAKIQQIPGKDGVGLFAGNAFYHWGIELSVKPRISPDGLISVLITPAISELDTDVSEDGFYSIKGADTDSAYSRYPIIKVKSITTEFTMKSGSTAVIGGLSRTTEEDIDSGIPYLRKIPWIGQTIFGWKSRQKMQKEIIVFVTLGIADPANLPKDLGLPKNAIVSREYVEGRELEPGDRAGTAAEVMKLDTRPLHERDSAARPGKPAEPVREDSHAQPAKPAGTVSVRLSE